MLKPIPCTIMRGGTSKGLYLRSVDLPADRDARDRVLLAAMGSPHPRQIDGLGGAHPLTSKVAVVGPPSRPDADVDYLFLQVSVTEALVSDSQNCGNLLAGIGPYAIENGLVAASSPATSVRIHMVNTRSVAVARVETPGGRVEYEGDTRIDGVPGTASAIPIEFLATAGSNCGSLFPTGNVVDRVDGIDATCIDNGMPVVLMVAKDLGKQGDESPEALEQDRALAARVERIRLELGPRMNLGDVRAKTVPKMALVSQPRAGGAINTRMFIPHRVHEAIGVLGAVSVATACVVPDSVAQRESRGIAPSGTRRIEVEHPTGFFTVELDVANGDGIGGVVVRRSALIRTARKLMCGEMYVPARAWEPA
jgi:4-oxalomesaconate tautomerase